MTKEKIKRIHQCYSWILAAMVTIVGILLILGCLGIYNSGPRPYSPEAISIAFLRICIPVYIMLLGIFGGILLNLFLPQNKKRTKSPSRPEVSLAKLKQKTGELEISAKETKVRRFTGIGTGVIYALLMVYPTIYVLTPSNFTVANLNGDIIRAVLIIMLPAVLGLGVCYLCRVLINTSLTREITVYKKALADGQRNTAIPQSQVSSPRRLLYIRVGIFLLAAILIVLGIFNGGVDDVLKKAIAICTECIGLG